MVRHLVISLKNTFELIFRYLNAIVADVYSYVLLVCIKATCYFPSFRGELEGIGEQICQHLIYIVGIDRNKELVFDAIFFECDILFPNISLKHLNGLPDDMNNVAISHLKFESIIFKPVKVHQLINQLQHPLRIPLDRTR